MCRLESQASQAGVAVLAVSVPFSLESGTVPSVPAAKYPVTFTASFDSSSDAAVAALRAALSAGHTVEIDVQGSGEENWERLEDLLTKATADGLETGLIVLCECFYGLGLPPNRAELLHQTANVLPPPHNLDLPIVKLLTHPTYHSYQSHIATLSLFPRVYLSYVPPSWNATTPPTPQDAAAASKANKEWKRRIKMYCKLPRAHSLCYRYPLSSG
jgi:hypothetical protein